MAGERLHLPPPLAVRSPASPTSPTSSRFAPSWGSSAAAEIATSSVSTHVASPIKRHHYPTRWSERSIDKSKVASAKATANDDSGTDRGTSKLLEVLGMSPVSLPMDPEAMSNSHARLSPRLPAFAPPHLQQCTEDCYWKWLVHTLSQEVDSLKRSLGEAQDEFKKRTEQRRKIEHVIGHRDQILDDVVSMTETLRKLRVDVPQARKDFDKWQGQADHLEEKRSVFIAKQNDLKKQIQTSTERQRDDGRKFETMESRREKLSKDETDLSEQIQHDKEEMERKQEELERMQTERDEMRDEVNTLEEAKKNRKKAAKKK